jgi:hypothetical protein
VHKDAAVLKAVPSRGFITEYVNYARAANPAIPLIYQVGAAYALASSLINYDPRIPIPDHDRPTSLWPLIVGVSGSGKSSAIMLARGLFEEITGEPPESLPGSAQGLYKSAINATSTDDDGNPSAVLRYWEDDLGKMLSSTKQQQHAAPLRAALLQFYDGQSRKEILATKEYVAPRNRTTLCAGVTPAQISKDTDTAEWETGFFSRFMFFYHESTMIPKMCEFSDDYMTDMRTRLVKLGRAAWLNTECHQRDLFTFEPCPSGVKIPWRLTSLKGQKDCFYDETARRVYEHMRDTFVKREGAANRYARGPIQRATDMGMRAAAIIRWSQPFAIQNWRFMREDIEQGFALAKLHVASASRVAELVSADQFNALCNDLLESMRTLTEQGELFATQGRIHTQLRLMDKRHQPRRLKEALDHEVATRAIFTGEKHLDDSGIPETVYALREIESLPSSQRHHG